MAVGRGSLESRIRYLDLSPGRVESIDVRVMFKDQEAIDEEGHQVAYYINTEVSLGIRSQTHLIIPRPHLDEQTRNPVELRETRLFERVDYGQVE
jgi:hypothetical protein